MNTHSFIVRALCALAAIVLAPSGALAQLATGPNSAVDGYLRVSPDAYGSWASTTFGGAGDLFNPAGAPGALESAFTAGSFLFVGGTRRELLTDNTTWNGAGGINAAIDTTLNRTVLSPNIGSDTNFDGVNDQFNSAFRVFGGGPGVTDLNFNLTQNVGSGGPGVAFIRQDYHVTNNGAGPVSFSMVRVFDGDLPWGGGGASFYLDDEVGTTMHGAGLGTFVYQQEAAMPGTTAVTLSGNTAGPYFGGKNGVMPGGVAPAFGFGTDVQVWDAFGVPTNWDNFVAGVGAGVNGNSGTTGGSLDPNPDGFIGLGYDVVDLQPGQSTTLTVIHTFGQATPIPEPASLVLLILGAACLVRRRAQ